MREQSWFNLIAGTVAMVIVVLGALAISYPSGAAPAPATSTASSGSPVVYRNLSIAFDPSAGAFDYSTTTLSVPSNVRVVFTITNYDPSSAMVPAASDARVAGTLGGMITVSTDGSTATVPSVPISDVSHTFTISSGAVHLNVPIPPASPTGTPTQVTFSVDFTVPGTFTWGCVVLCGADGTMVQSAMYGTISVA